MRINSIPTKELFNQYVHVRESRPVAPMPSGTDRTELTHGAKVFSAALKEAMETMEARTPGQFEHIRAVAEQIANNTYSVPGRKVAEKILGV